MDNKKIKLKKDIIIAVDGYSSSGKSTLAKDLANMLKYKYIDTGAMYRAITWFALKNNFIDKNGKKVEAEGLKNILSHIHLDFKNINGKNHIFLNGNDVENEIRTLTISRLTSLVSKVPFIREFLVNMQRQIGKQKGIVMDGRDIGSVVFPDAEVKFFVTASPEIRAKRRYLELLDKGEKVSYEEVLKNLKNRDLQDTTRSISPLIKTNDAIVIDNSSLTREEQLRIAIEHIIKKIGVDETN